MIMNDEDLRDCFAMFAMCGVLMEGFVAKDNLAKEVAELSYEMADAMELEHPEHPFAGHRRHRESLPADVEG